MKDSTDFVSSLAGEFKSIVEETSISPGNAAMPVGFPLPRSCRPLAKHVRDVAIFAVCYVALDWVSYNSLHGMFSHTLWNPLSALSIAWMMLGGLGNAPIVFGTMFVADIIIHGAPAGLMLAALTSLVLAGGYSAVAGILRYFFKFNSRLSDTRHLWQGIHTRIRSWSRI